MVILYALLQAVIISIVIIIAICILILLIKRKFKKVLPRFAIWIKNKYTYIA